MVRTTPSLGVRRRGTRGTMDWGILWLTGYEGQVCPERGHTAKRANPIMTPWPTALPSAQTSSIHLNPQRLSVSCNITITVKTFWFQCVTMDIKLQNQSQPHAIPPLHGNACTSPPLHDQQLLKNDPKERKDSSPYFNQDNFDDTDEAAIGTFLMRDTSGVLRGFSPPQPKVNKIIYLQFISYVIIILVE